MIEEKESIAIKKLVNQNIVGEKNLKIKVKKEKFKFIDLFAGIGGFHLAMHSVGGKCVFASEWDKFARVTYEENFKAENPELFETGNFNCLIS